MSEASLQLALELLRRIPRGRSVTSKQLCQQLKDAGFERDIRSIQRQLDKLSEQFQEFIECDERSKPYGYRWLPNASGLNLPGLTPHESLLLSLAERHLKNLLPARLMNSLSGFFADARRNLLPHQTNTRLERQWQEKVRVVPEALRLLPPKIDPKVFEAVSNALYENFWLTLDYRNAGGRRDTIEVMPLGLAQQGVRLYLVVRYRGFENERSLALHRILSAKISTLRFERPAGFSLQAYDDDGRFAFGEGQRVHLAFRIEKCCGAHLLETPLAKDQEVIEHEDDYEIHATMVDSKMLDGWLLSFGDDVWDVKKEAVDDSSEAPPHVRQNVRRLMQDVVSR